MSIRLYMEVTHRSVKVAEVHGRSQEAKPCGGGRLGIEKCDSRTEKAGLARLRWFRAGHSKLDHAVEAGHEARGPREEKAA